MLTRALINRNFALIVSGGMISALGDFVFDTTLVLWIATRLAPGRSWAPLAVSGVLFAAMIPMALVGPLAGVFVDRWDKRRTMLAADAVRAALILAVLLPAGLIPGIPAPPVAVRLAAVYMTVFLSAVSAQFFAPARMALTRDVVGDGNLTRASGLSQLTMPLGFIVGPALAGPLLIGLGAEWAFLLNAASFLLSFLTIAPVQAPPAARSVMDGEEGHAWRELTAGLRLVSQSRVLVTLVVAAIVAMCGVGALNALDVFFALHNLHAAPSLYGVLSSVMGAGTIVGAVAAGMLARQLGTRRLFWWGLALSGACLVVYSRQAAFVPGAIALFLTGIPAAGLNVAVMPLLMEATPREFVGRVNAVVNTAVSVASMASMVAAGFLASAVLRTWHASLFGQPFSAVDTILGVAGVLCLVAGLYAGWGLRSRDVAEVCQAA